MLTFKPRPEPSRARSVGKGKSPSSRSRHTDIPGPSPSNSSSEEHREASEKRLASVENLRLEHLPSQEEMMTRSLKLAQEITEQARVTVNTLDRQMEAQKSVQWAERFHFAEIFGEFGRDRWNVVRGRVRDMDSIMQQTSGEHLQIPKGDECENTGATAFTKDGVGSGVASPISLCPPFFRSGRDLVSLASVLIHEVAHLEVGSASGKDVYGERREFDAIELLHPGYAVNNPDSLVAFIMFASQRTAVSTLDQFAQLYGRQRPRVDGFELQQEQFVRLGVADPDVVIRSLADESDWLFTVLASAQTMLKADAGATTLSEGMDAYMLMPAGADVLMHLRPLLDSPVLQLIDYHALTTEGRKYGSDDPVWEALESVWPADRSMYPFAKNWWTLMHCVAMLGLSSVHQIKKVAERARDELAGRKFRVVSSTADHLLSTRDDEYLLRVDPAIVDGAIGDSAEDARIVGRDATRFVFAAFYESVGAPQPALWGALAEGTKLILP